MTTPGQLTLRCDCGNLEITAPIPAQVTVCNCGICRRYAALWAYYSPGEVTLQVGEAGVALWQRGDREIEFVRCARCGCVSHYRTLPGDTDPLIALNTRLAEPALAGVPVRQADNASR
ncbi:GFA family protein [Salinicola tamaricis]|uniref:GFA family protein n=1 Tax=Salinicola tamaricis TaxID=1771309 RepID=UPI001A91499C|nr:aldehyde-activating protein [Salinicola tamaricis]